MDRLSDAGSTGAGAMRFGANYVPSKGWFYSWLDFDPEAVRRDLADIASLGLDHVRIFPVWPWIQPNRGLIRRDAVDDVLAVIDLARAAGLGVAVDVIQGHLSSFDFLPSWVLTWHQSSVFTDRRVRAGLAEYVSELAGAVGTRDNCFAITLGNEVNNLYPTNDVDPAAASAWAAELLDVVRAAAPHLTALHSVYDDAWYAADHPFGAADAVTLGDLTTVHSWVFNGATAIAGGLAPAATSHADYLVSLAAAFGPPDRPVWLQEIGAPLPDVGADVGLFVHRSLATVSPNPALWGITWWASHDIDRALVDFPDREYDLGLFTVDHRPKPAGKALQEFLRSVPGRAPDGRRTGLVCPVDPVLDPLARAAVAPGSPFHLGWVRLRESGPVSIVAPGKARDAEHLASRGISELAVLGTELADFPC